MMSKTDWFCSQTEEELMTEERAKELRLRRNRLRHAFKDEINRLTGGGQESDDGREVRAVPSLLRADGYLTSRDAAHGFRAAPAEGDGRAW